MSEIKVNTLRHLDDNGVVSIGNSAVMLPKGTTAQRPSGVAGQIRYNTTLNKVEFHNGSGWYQFTDNYFAGSGGNVTTFGIYTLHTFTSNGTFTVEGTGEIDILVVGGGGQGGLPTNNSNYGGGGGAGGLVWYTGYNATAGNYSIVVGDGGAQTSSGSGNRQGNDGADSTAFGLTAKGGGGGGGQGGEDKGRAGGSGGGGGYADNGGAAQQPSTSNTLSSGTLVHNLGNAGASGNTSPNGGGGGGGAGGSGYTGGTGNGVNGGLGHNMSSLLGTAVGDNGWFSGGGGGSQQAGASYVDSWGNGGQNNYGGGGRGCRYNTATSTPGGVNTGGGGGAGSSAIGGRGGGSGVVIIRYET
tara:strand:- start:56 stop:1123 length:1068 start_codon:yes stop_codon:yes gene_type:complete